MFNIRISAQADIAQALRYWKNGDISAAQELASKFIKDNPDHDKAKYLLMKAFYIQGQYTKAIEIFSAIRKTFSQHKESAHLAAQAYMHLREFDEALNLAEMHKLFPLALIKEWRMNPFTVQANQTYVIPFTDDLFEMDHYKFSSDLWPGIKGSINGIHCDLRLDTGGDYLVIGKEAAQKLNINLNYKTKSLHNITTVNAWLATVEKMNFDNGPEFFNVPVTVFETLGNAVIIGTNILEQFLTTLDYPDRRFILTPRNNSSLKETHYAMLPEKQTQTPFCLWGDHYMIAKGKFSTHDSINLFFDSGLLSLTEKDGKEIQASFFVSKQTLVKWGFDKNKLAQSNFLFTDYPLEVAGFSQPNTLIWYDKGLKKDRNFGGVRIDGLISHAWLKNYSWTLDFDNMKYTFGIPK